MNNTIINRLNKIQNNFPKFDIEKVLTSFKETNISNKGKELCIHFFLHDFQNAYDQKNIISNKGK